MRDPRTTSYEAFLRSFDPRLFIERDAHSRDRGRPAVWVKYRLAANLPLKLVAISEFEEYGDGPGDWLVRVLERVDWRWMIQSARTAFARKKDLRAEIGITDARSVPVR